MKKIIAATATAALLAISSPADARPVTIHRQVECITIEHDGEFFRHWMRWRWVINDHQQHTHAIATKWRREHWRHDWYVKYCKGQYS